MYTRNLGDLGENDFNRWCSQTGLVANKSDRDRTGWDYLIEFPRISQLKDENPFTRSPLTCWVQVKATDSTESHFDGIKLSVWHRLIMQPLPAFFCIIGYDGLLDPQTTALVHLGEKQISDFFSRIRKDRISITELHNHSMRLHWDNEDLIKPVNGLGLRDTLMRHIGEDHRAYIHKKMQFIQHESSVTAKISTSFSFGMTEQGKSEDESFQELVDFSIGLTDEVTIRTSFFEVDGRSAFDSIPKTSAATLKISNSNGPPPPTGKAMVSMFTIDGMNRASIPCEYYSPAAQFPFIPQKYWKIRYASPCVDFIHSLGEISTLNFLLRAGGMIGHHPLKTLRQVSQLLHVLDRAHDGIGFSIEIDGVLALSGSVPSCDRLDLPQHWKASTDLVEFMWSIAIDFGANTDELTSWGELECQEKQIRTARVLLHKPELFHHVESVVQFPALDPTHHVGWPVISRIILGNSVMFVAGALHGFPSYIGPPDEEGFRAVRIEHPKSVVISKNILNIAEEETIHLKQIKKRLGSWFDQNNIELFKDETWDDEPSDPKGGIGSGQE